MWKSKGFSSPRQCRDVYNLIKSTPPKLRQSNCDWTRYKMPRNIESNHILTKCHILEEQPQELCTYIRPSVRHRIFQMKRKNGHVHSHMLKVTCLVQVLEFSPLLWLRRAPFLWILLHFYADKFNPFRHSFLYFFFFFGKNWNCRFIVWDRFSFLIRNFV